MRESPSAIRKEKTRAAVLCRRDLDPCPARRNSPAPSYRSPPSPSRCTWRPFPQRRPRNARKTNECRQSRRASKARNAVSNFGIVPRRPPRIASEKRVLCCGRPQGFSPAPAVLSPVPVEEPPKALRVLSTVGHGRGHDAHAPHLPLALAPHSVTTCSVRPTARRHQGWRPPGPSTGPEVDAPNRQPADILDGLRCLWSTTVEQ